MVLADVSAMGLAQLGAMSTLAYVLYKVVSVALGDTDLRTQWLRKPPRNAFEGRVVWITGASQGLGELLAHSMFAQGAKLILSARREDQLNRVAKALGDPSRVKILPLDLTGSSREMGAAVTQAGFMFGGRGIDILMHVAGSSQRGRVEDTSITVDDAIMKLNAYAPIALTKAILPSMLEKGKGQIVLISSMAAKIWSPGQATYAAAKAAASSYHHTLHCEVCDRGVDVSVIYGGPIASGSADNPRTVYGPEGPEPLPPAPAGSSRLSMERFIELVVLGTYHRVPELWASKHPVLIMAYLSQYFPSLAGWLLRKVGPKRARAMDPRAEGGDRGYSVSGLLSKGKQ